MVDWLMIWVVLKTVAPRNCSVWGTTCPLGNLAPHLNPISQCLNPWLQRSSGSECDASWRLWMGRQHDLSFLHSGSTVMISCDIKKRCGKYMPDIYEIVSQLSSKNTEDLGKCPCMVSQLSHQNHRPMLSKVAPSSVKAIGPGHGLIATVAPVQGIPHQAGRCRDVQIFLRVLDHFYWYKHCWHWNQKQFFIIKHCWNESSNNPWAHQNQFWSYQQIRLLGSSSAPRPDTHLGKGSPAASPPHVWS